MQANNGKNFLILINVLHVQGIFYTKIQVVLRQNRFYESIFWKVCWLVVFGFNATLTAKFWKVTAILFQVPIWLYIVRALGIVLQSLIISCDNQVDFHGSIFMCLFVGCLTPYQQYFSYLTATVHKAMFPRLFLTSTKPVIPTVAGQS